MKKIEWWSLRSVPLVVLKAVEREISRRSAPVREEEKKTPKTTVTMKARRKIWR
jgi:hypothetical protein